MDGGRTGTDGWTGGRTGMDGCTDGYGRVDGRVRTGGLREWRLGPGPCRGPGPMARAMGGARAPGPTTLSGHLAHTKISTSFGPRLELILVPY